MPAERRQVLGQAGRPGADKTGYRAPDRNLLERACSSATLLCSTLAPLMITVQFVGSGDAFGSGGRLQAAISLRNASTHVLLDCGTSSLIGLARLGLAPTSIDAVLVSHLHGDHFGGIPFLVLHQQFARRERPLLLVGPPGLRNRVMEAMEVLFPGSSQIERRFELQITELSERVSTAVGPLEVIAIRCPREWRSVLRITGDLRQQDRRVLGRHRMDRCID
jgi:ribonuclease BN (tRNA processing enzyme)